MTEGCVQDSQLGEYIYPARGLPIVGDPIYGRNVRDRLLRPALHAAVLGFLHPRSGESLRFEAPLPADLAAALRELKTTGRIS